MPHGNGFSPPGCDAGFDVPVREVGSKEDCVGRLRDAADLSDEPDAVRARDEGVGDAGVLQELHPGTALHRRGEQAVVVEAQPFPDGDARGHQARDEVPRVWPPVVADLQHGAAGRE